jgi:hypothetical protein
MKIIEKGARIVCPHCGRVLYVFKCDMPETTIIAMTPTYVEEVFPQHPMPLPIYMDECVLCRRSVNLLEQIRQLVGFSRDFKIN